MDAYQKTNETMEDYLARLNFEGARTNWLSNHSKIKYIFNKSIKYLKPDMSVCEIGIGDGYLLRLLHYFGLKPIGIDISNYIINKLSKIFNQKGFEINLIQHDITKSIEYTNYFDIIYCLDILEHIEGEGLTKVIKNIKEMLKKDGLLVVTLPWRENLDNQKVICPKCGHKFHRIGHFHSFNSYVDIVNIFSENFKIFKFGFVEISYISKILFLLYKTVFRRKYYRKRLFEISDTCFFIALLK